MLHILSKRIAFLVCKKTDKIPFEIYVYGFELLVSSIIETGALILIGGLIGKFVETMGRKSIRLLLRCKRSALCSKLQGKFFNRRSNILLRSQLER